MAAFTIEERFRDIKDWRFGMGVSAVKMESTQRRDRLLLIIVLCADPSHSGAAGELHWKCRGSSKPTPSNPASTSLYRQGQIYLQLFPTMPQTQSESSSTNS